MRRALRRYVLGGHAGVTGTHYGLVCFHALFCQHFRRVSFPRPTTPCRFFDAEHFDTVQLFTLSYGRVAHDCISGECTHVADLAELARQSVGACQTDAFQRRGRLGEPIGRIVVQLNSSVSKM